VRPRDGFKLVVLAGGDWSPFAEQVRRLGLEDRVLVRENVFEIEDYLQAADLGLFTSASESFCLSVLEAMWFGCPSVTTAVGGIPEVVRDGETGVLVPEATPEALALAVDALLSDPARRARMGLAAKARAAAEFSADAIVPRYEALYRRVLAQP
jgi:glycosyltransferase involved in cell wall biosynthesis